MNGTKLNIRVTQDLYAKVKTESAKQLVTMNEYTKTALESKMKEYNNKANYEKTVKKVCIVIDKENLTPAEKLIILVIMRLGESQRTLENISRKSGYSIRKVKTVCNNLDISEFITL